MKGRLAGERAKEKEARQRDMMQLSCDDKCSQKSSSSSSSSSDEGRTSRLTRQKKEDDEEEGVIGLSFPIR